MYYENFDALCKARGVTPNAVSKATGISTATLTSWKKGVYTPKNDKLERIAEYFNVDLSYLLTGKHAAKTSDSGKQYYFSDETAEIAQRIFDDPTLRALFDATRGLTPDALEAVEKMLKAMKASNPDG